MENLINKLVKLLKNKVNQNNIEIQYNQDEIRRLLNTEFGKDKENKTLKERSLINEELFMENEDFMHLQIQLSEFSEKYAHLFESIQKEIPKQEDRSSIPYFTKTVEGEMVFEPGHPQFFNAHFFNKLLKYYQENEDYEMCDYLVKVKSTENKF
ncbi:MAG: hypothetical protein K9H49_13745 [Bacteroidales bacterium]|nr:hypothetical protein [Bacteroidales bacterium]MCF8390517.1 hypothetical protein [Bacteroidales bacterium]